MKRILPTLVAVLTTTLLAASVRAERNDDAAGKLGFKLGMQSYTYRALPPLTRLQPKSPKSKELQGSRYVRLADCMKKRLGGKDTPFYYTLPAASLAPKITKPSAIKGRSEALAITDWQDGAAITNRIGKAAKWL